MFRTSPFSLAEQRSRRIPQEKVKLSGILKKLSTLITFVRAPCIHLADNVGGIEIPLPPLPSAPQEVRSTWMPIVDINFAFTRCTSRATAFPPRTLHTSHHRPRISLKPYQPLGVTRSPENVSNRPLHPNPGSRPTKQGFLVATDYRSIAVHRFSTSHKTQSHVPRLVSTRRHTPPPSSNPYIYNNVVSMCEERVNP